MTIENGDYFFPVGDEGERVNLEHDCEINEPLESVVGKRDEPAAGERKSGAHEQVSVDERNRPNGLLPVLCLETFTDESPDRDADEEVLGVWRNAVVEAPISGRAEHIVDAPGGTRGGGTSTREQLKSIGIDANRAELLPNEMKEDLRPFMTAQTQQGRDLAMAELQRRSNSDTGVNATHAKFALQQARLMDAAIRLDQAERERERSRGTHGYKTAEDRVQNVIREIVRMEGAPAANATKYLSGHAAHLNEVKKPTAVQNQGQEFSARVTAIRADESRQNELAIDLLRDPMKRTTKVMPTPKAYADALERLQAMADKNDDAAIKALEPLKNDVPRIISALKGSDQQQAMAAKVELERRLKRPTDVGVNRHDILSDINPKDLENALVAERQAIEKNINGIANVVDTFSTVTNQQTADRQTRETSIAAVRNQVLESHELRLVPVIDWMESTNAKLNVLETSDPGAAAVVIRNLHNFAQKPFSDDRGNVSAGLALAKMTGAGESYTSLIDKLENKDPKIAKKALKELQERLPRNEIIDELNDRRARALLVTLPEGYKSSDVDKLIEKLEPVTRDNSHTADVLHWARAEAELKRIEESAGNLETINKAVDKLLDQADQNNKYARLAVSALLLRDEDALRWNNDVLAKTSDRSLATDALRSSCKGRDEVAAVVQLRIAHCYDEVVQKDPGRLNEAEACAVALLASRAPAESDLRKTLSRTVEQSVECNNAVHAGVFEAVKIREGVDSQHFLSKMYVKGVTAERMQTEEFRKQYGELYKVVTQNEEAVRVMTALACGHEFEPGHPKSSRYLEDSRKLVLWLSDQRSTAASTLAALKQVGEDEMERLEGMYDPFDRIAAEDIAKAHDFMGEAYEHCGDKVRAEIHRYEASEIRRVQHGLERKTPSDPIGAMFDSLRPLPDQFTLNLQSNKLEADLGKGGLLHMVDSRPAYRIPRMVHDLLTAVEKVSLSSDKLAIRGNGAIRLAPEMLTVDEKVKSVALLMNGWNLDDVAISLKNLTSDVAVDPVKGTINLSKIEGLNLRIGMTKPPGEHFMPVADNIELSIDKTNPNEPQLAVKVRFAAQLPGKGGQEQTFRIPIGKGQEQQFNVLLEELAKPGDSADLRKLTALLASEKKDSLLDQLFTGTESVSRDKDSFKLTRSDVANLEVGGRKLQVGKDVEFNIHALQHKIDGMKGVSIENPFPADVQKQLGIEGNIVIKKIEFGRVDANGARELRITTSPPLEYVSVKLDKNLKPVGKDISFGMILEGSKVDATLMVKDLEKGMNGDWNLKLNGSHEARKKLLESFGAPSNVADALKDVYSVTKVGSKFEIEVGGESPAKITIPVDIGQKGFMKSDWTMELKGTQKQNKELLTRLGIPSQAADVLKKADVITKEGDKITVSGSPQEIDFDGLKLSLDRKVTLELKENGDDLTLTMTGVELTDVPISGFTGADTIKSIVRASLPEKIKKITLHRDKEGKVDRMTIDQGDHFIKGGSTIEFDKDMNMTSADLRVNNPLSKALYGSADTESKIILKRVDGQIVCDNRTDIGFHTVAGTITESKIVQGTLLAIPGGVAVVGAAYWLRRR